MRRNVISRVAWLLSAAAVAGALGLPVAARAQAPTGGPTECEVVSTFLGVWNGVDVRCGPSAEGSRAASVTVEALRTCPLLAGDRVDVGYVDDDPRRQPLVLAVATRGTGDSSSGDWCTRGLPPGLYVGPCLLEENPPRGEASDSVGATSTRRQLTTWFRTTDDGRTSVSPGGCRPARLTGGVYRIYVEESMRTSVRVPGPTYFADRRTSERTEYETVRYEGGLFVDASLPASDDVTDVSGFVRGWTASPTGQPRVRTERIRMTGLRVEQVRVRTEGIQMTGLRVEQVRVRTDGIQMTGLRVERIRVRTEPIVMTGRRPSGT